MLHIDSSASGSYTSAMVVHGTYFGYTIIMTGVIIGMFTGTKMSMLPKVVSLKLII